MWGISRRKKSQLSLYPLHLVCSWPNIWKTWSSFLIGETVYDTLNFSEFLFFVSASLSCCFLVLHSVFSVFDFRDSHGWEGGIGSGRKMRINVCKCSRLFFFNPLVGTTTNTMTSENALSGQWFWQASTCSPQFPVTCLRRQSLVHFLISHFHFTDSKTVISHCLVSLLSCVRNRIHHICLLSVNSLHCMSL